jgi:hypothetical protein
MMLFWVLFQVPKEHCKQVPKKVEKQVPRTKCQKVPDKRCQDFPINVPRKECKEFPKTICTQAPAKLSTFNRIVVRSLYVLFINKSRCLLSISLVRIFKFLFAFKKASTAYVAGK